MLLNLRRRLQLSLLLAVIFLAFSVSSIWIAYVSTFSCVGGVVTAWLAL